jgi:RNA-directed DNA polymerase
MIGEPRWERQWKPMTHGPQKSDPSIVAVKLTNNPGRSGAESAEPREGAKGNTGKTRTRRTPSRESVFPGLERVRERARKKKKERFTALLHHVNVDLLRAAFYRLKRGCGSGSGWPDMAGVALHAAPHPAHNEPHVK